MVPLHHQTTPTESVEESPSVPPASPQKGRGEDAPFENCAEKWRVGTINVNLYTPCCTDVTSLCAPLAIEGHVDRDGKTKPAPVMVKIEGAERGKEGGTAPAVTTTAPEQPLGLAGDSCCKCGPQSSCKTTRCGYRREGCNCTSYRCLMRCANVAP